MDKGDIREEIECGLEEYYQDKEEKQKNLRRAAKSRNKSNEKDEQYEEYLRETANEPQAEYYHEKDEKQNNLRRAAQSRNRNNEAGEQYAASNRQWFETYIFDENFDMKQEYEDKLLSLPWVEEFYIGVTHEPEKSWQIFITCAPNTVPSMADLKKTFGTNIASFVHFIQESIDEKSKDSKEFLPSPSYLVRGPISGDKFCVEGPKGGYGSIGIITGDSKKHYATTCYHACFIGDFPKNDIKKGHKILKEDYANGSPRCKGATCVYTTEQKPQPKLGQFCHGLYDDNHDIALIELEPSVNCSDMAEFLAKKTISPALADKKQVKDMLFEMKELPVEIICPAPTKGVLFAVTGVRRCTKNKRCYRIRRNGKKDFATEGDSGSLVYLIYQGEKIPFAYVCMVIPEPGEVVYYCRSMDHSIKQLIKRHIPKSSMQPCLEKCGKTIVE